MHKCRPILWLPFALPIGVSTGYVATSIANALTRAGLSETAAADMIAAYFLATTLGALWGPLVDSAITRRFWVTAGVILTAAALALITLVPMTTAYTLILSLCAFSSGTGAIIVGLACKSIAAYVLPLDQRTLAGAWYSAGNMGGSFGVGAVGVWLLNSGCPRLLIAMLVAASVLVSLLAVLRLPKEQNQSMQGILGRLKFSLLDVWHMVRTPKGSIALLICISPFGTGMASILLASAAPLWHAAPGIVSTTSLLSVPVSVAAALGGGWFAVRVGAWRAYLILGILIAVLGITGSLLPHAAFGFVALSLMYAFALGAIFSGFYALVFDTVGQGAASTKIGALVSLCNLPFWYQALIEGRAVDRWGISGLLLSDAALGFVGFFAIACLARFVGMRLWRNAGAAASDTIAVPRR
jgi:hypothetical protein